MNARGTWYVALGWLLLLLALGCRSTQPNLKPPTQAETLNAPPAEARYSDPAYPKQAFARDEDPTKKYGPGGPGNPGRGGPSGMNSMGAMGSGSGMSGAAGAGGAGVP